MRPTRLLVYRLGSLGDTIVCIPALRLVARAFPDATRTMLTNYSVSTKAAPIAEILENTGLIHDYMEYPLKLRNPRALLALRNRIRALRPDLLVYLTPPRGRLKALRDALFFYACGIKTVVGVPYTNDKQVNRKLTTGLYEYEGTRLLRCIESLGFQDMDEPEVFDLALTEAEYQAANEVLAPFGGAPVLAVSIGTKADVNDWGDASWRATLARLSETMPGWTLVMLGAPMERERSAALAALWSGSKLNVCGQTSVRGSAAILSRVKIYLGHDSGPLHLAAAVGVPCVAIFSSRNLPGEWFPKGSGHKILYHDINCRGCRLTVCSERDKECIRSISVAEVVSAVQSLL